MSQRSGSRLPWPPVVAALAVAAAVGTWLQFSGGAAPRVAAPSPPMPVPERPIVRYAEPAGVPWPPCRRRSSGSCPGSAPLPMCMPT